MRVLLPGVCIFGADSLLPGVRDQEDAVHHQDQAVEDLGEGGDAGKHGQQHGGA